MDPRHGRRLSKVTAAVVIVVATLAGCRPPVEPDTVAPMPVTVESAALGLRFVDLPTDFVVAINDDAEFVLDHAESATRGRIVVSVSPPDAGQNLVSAVSFHQAFIENQEGGQYQGGQELIGPLGTAFYSRGRFELDGETIEETVVFTLHPAGDRMMNLRYRYPAGVDSSIRVQQLFDVLATVEGLDTVRGEQ